jgi:c-di-GMP-binding flagellar brake protein YcgR
MGKEERETKPHLGMVNFERRRHPRVVVDLPVEYWKINHYKSCPSRARNVGEGGLLLHLSEHLEMGQNLRLNLFIDVGPDLNSIDAVVQVVWKDIHQGEDGEVRTGVKFVDISPEDMDKLKHFLLSRRKEPLRS